MKVFFSTTPKAKNEYSDNIKKIYEVLRKLGHRLTDEIIEKISVEDFYSWNANQRRDYYYKTINTIKISDICIFEASRPSLGVGHLISQALSFNKPIIVLFVKGKEPFMLDSAGDSKIILTEYNVSNLMNELSVAIDYAKEKADVRFNFFISPAIGTYLDWISKVKKIPRSVFLRGLIEKDIADNEEYN